MTDDRPTFLVIYRYVEDMENRRTPYRPEHLGWLGRLHEAGRLVLAGATREPVDTGVLIFRDDDADAVRQLLTEDPYAKAGLITGVEVRPIGLAFGG